MIFILFRVGGDTLAMDVERVVEVIPLLTVRKVPHVPDYVLGVMNYRGTAVPVIDLSALHSGTPSRRVLSTRIVIVRFGGPEGTERMIGLAGERVTETIRAERGDFQPPGVRTEANRFLGDILVDGGAAIQLVEPEAILTPEAFDMLLAGGTTAKPRKKARRA